MTQTELQIEALSLAKSYARNLKRFREYIADYRQRLVDAPESFDYDVSYESPEKTVTTLINFQNNFVHNLRPDTIAQYGIRVSVAKVEFISALREVMAADELMPIFEELNKQPADVIRLVNAVMEGKS